MTCDTDPQILRCFFLSCGQLKVKVTAACINFFNLSTKCRTMKKASRNIQPELIARVDEDTNYMYREVKEHLQTNI